MTCDSMEVEMHIKMNILEWKHLKNIIIAHARMDICDKFVDQIERDCKKHHMPGPFRKIIENTPIVQ